jgi:enoyl-CoA hydratase
VNDTDPILSTRDGPVATVTLNRPDKLNALTRTMWRDLADAVSWVSSDDAVRCLVICGSGGRAFSPGDDIGEFESERATPERAKAHTAHMHHAIEAIRECRHPTVAMIEGVCAGGGLILAAACDIRVCGERSRFGVPIKRLGLVLPHAEIRMLLDQIGKAKTLEILLEGEVFSSEKALAMGLVNHVFPDGDVRTEAYAIARKIAEGAPLAARWHKKFVRQLLQGEPLSQADRDEAYAYAATEDFRAGYRAFLEKRKPDFSGC